MTLRKFEEQTVILETPSGTDTYTHVGSSIYKVSSDVNDVSSNTTAFSASDYNSGSKFTTFTWTCPEDGLYQLTADASRISNSVNIWVDDTRVVSNYAARFEPNRGKETDIVQTARVLYTGQKVTFNFYNVEHTRTFTATVRKARQMTNIKFGSNNSDNSLVHKNWPVKAPVFTTSKE